MKNKLNTNFSFVLALIATNIFCLIKEDYTTVIILTGITTLFLTMHLTLYFAEANSGGEHKEMKQQSYS